jgi:hypothetical protein
MVSTSTKESTVMLTRSKIPFTLSNLFAHPEIQKGIQDAHNAVQERVFGGTKAEMFADLQTEDDVMTFVDEELSRESCLREQEDKRPGYQPPSYWYHIGFTLGWLEQAMSYHQHQQVGNI